MNAFVCEKNYMAFNPITNRTFAFALKIVKILKKLKTNGEFMLTNQLVRSGTSIGANMEEAGAAQSRKDFISKMSIASKEARETKYWLRLIHESDVVDVDLVEPLEEAEHIINIITKIVLTAGRNSSKHNTQNSKQ